MTARIVLFTLGLLAIGCGLDDEDCHKACERPFVLANDKASVRAASWRNMPEPQRSQAAQIYADWAQNLTSQQAAWMTDCVPQCRKGDQSVLDCRRKATTLTAWKKCQP